MGGFSVKPNRLSKFTGHDAQLVDRDGVGSLLAIVKVARPDYVPDNVIVRQRIDALMFTAEFPPEVMEALEADDGVKAIAITKKLRLIE